MVFDTTRDRRVGYARLRRALEWVDCGQEHATRDDPALLRSCAHAPAPPAGLQAAFAALAAGRATEEEIVALAGPEAPRLYVHLEALARHGVLRWTAVSGDAPLASLSPVSTHFVLPPMSLEEGRRYRLSRFATLHFEDHGPVIACPTSHAIVAVEDRRVLSLLVDLARPVALRDLSRSAAGLDVAAASAFMRLLVGASMLAPEPDEGEVPSPTAVALRQWEPHDLAFHARSRDGRHAAHAGGTYRFEGEIPPLPAVKRGAQGARIELFRPDIGALRRADVPFTEVMERRRSRRGPASSPLTARLLGELLFRSARLRRILPTPRGELSERPYPGAGACYELEVYPVVRACSGVPEGLYHYCPEEHRLEQLAAAPPQVQALLFGARLATGSEHLPEVLLVIAARFQRVAWKYETIAYSLILKDTGVLVQTMCLVATAMGLSSSALGTGDADLFSQAAGTDYYAETSVGELIVGGPEA